MNAELLAPVSGHGLTADPAANLETLATLPAEELDALEHDLGETFDVCRASEPAVLASASDRTRSEPRGG